MQVPLEIVFRHVEKSAAVEATIRECVENLERFADEIVSCRVTIEAPHRHHRQSMLWRVSIDIHVPNANIVVSRDSAAHYAHKDVFITVHDAFDAARRQLQDRLRIEHAKVKAHGEPPHGRITELVREKNFGRIATPDGREVYFHRNNVLNADFDRLRAGTAVWFNEESGDRGPRATTVHVG